MAARLITYIADDKYQNGLNLIYVVWSLRGVTGAWSPNLPGFVTINIYWVKPRQWNRDSPGLLYELFL